MLPSVGVPALRQGDFSRKGLSPSRVASPATRKLHAKIAVVLLALLALYAWIPARSFQTFSLHAYHNDQYNLLTDGMLSGHLYLAEKVPAGLLALSDPYDPSANGQYRYQYGLWDQSLYGGHLYLYFGVSPVIALYLPYRVLTGLRMPNQLACVIFTFGALLFATGIILSIRRRYFREAPDWMVVAGVALVGASDLGCYLDSQSNIYQVAIAAGMFFSAGSLYFLTRAFEPTRHRMRWLALGGAWMALTVGARPHFALTGAIVFALAVLELWRRGERRSSTYAALALPFAGGGVLLALYNYLRFDSFLEFGASYQLGIVNMHTVGMFSPQRIWSTTYFMLFEPPTFNKTYPFVHPMPKFPSWLPRPDVFILERVTGILMGTPFLWVIPIAAFVAWRRRKARGVVPTVPRLEITWIAVTVVLIALVLTLAAPSMRYLADFAILVDVLAVVAWLYADGVLAAAPRRRLALRIAGATLLVASATMGPIFALPPPYHYADG